jgi:hypothetical protein
MPLDVRNLTRCIEHGFVDIDARDFAGRLAYLIHLSGDQPRTARNVQDAVPILATSLQDQVVSPWRLNSVCIALVETRSVPANFTFSLPISYDVIEDWAFTA